MMFWHTSAPHAPGDREMQLHLDHSWDQPGKWWNKMVGQTIITGIVQNQHWTFSFWHSLITNHVTVSVPVDHTVTQKCKPTNSVEQHHSAETTSWMNCQLVKEDGHPPLLWRGLSKSKREHHAMCSIKETMQRHGSTVESKCTSQPTCQCCSRDLIHQLNEKMHCQTQSVNLS